MIDARSASLVMTALIILAVLIGLGLAGWLALLLCRDLLHRRESPSSIAHDRSSRNPRLSYSQRVSRLVRSSGPKPKDRLGPEQSVFESNTDTENGSYLPQPVSRARSILFGRQRSPPAPPPTSLPPPPPPPQTKPRFRAQYQAQIRPRPSLQTPFEGLAERSQPVQSVSFIGSAPNFKGKGVVLDPTTYIRRRDEPLDFNGLERETVPVVANRRDFDLPKSPSPVLTPSPVLHSTRRVHLRAAPSRGLVSPTGTDTGFEQPGPSVTQQFRPTVSSSVPFKDIGLSRTDSQHGYETPDEANGSNMI